jgi:hypothetical protein
VYAVALGVLGLANVAAGGVGLARERRGS